jgi:hypothetical protein
MDLCLSSRDYRHLPLPRLSGGRRRLLSPGKHMMTVNSPTSTHSIHSGSRRSWSACRCGPAVEIGSFAIERSRKPQ